MNTLRKRTGRTASILASAALAALSIQSTALGQIRIAAYNINADTTGTAPNAGTPGVLQEIAQEDYNGITETPDIITLEETTSNTATVQPLVNDLNAMNLGATYAMSTLQGTLSAPGLTGNGPSAVIYNSSKLQLISSVGFGTLSSSGPARQIMRYEFQPLAYAPPEVDGQPVGGSAAFYVYVDHYKASGSGSETTNESRRNVEALQVRANAATLPADSRIIYTGDFNLENGSSEAAWTTLLKAGTGSDPGRAFDPINLGNGTWNNTSPFASAMSEATGFNENTGTLGTGTLSARFDFQLNSNATTDGHGFSIISGSYHVFGNGSVPFGKQVTASSYSKTVQNSLMSSSDHYPVVADYRLPASMNATAAIASRVIVGATNVGTVSVTNNAPVAASVASVAADTLTYTMASSGSFTGTGVGTDLVALNTNTHALSLSPSAMPGVTTGTITTAVAGDSVNQEVQNVPSPFAISTTVVSHAHPSLAYTSGVSSITINFGTRAFNSAALGLGTPSASFAVKNVADVSGYTAALNLNSILGSGSISQFSTGLGTFTNLAAGGSNSYTASLLTNSYGSFSASYTLNLADENIPGATSTAPLVVNLVGQIAMAGDVNDDGTVNALDFNALATNYGQPAQTWSGGDFNGDGNVDSTDFDALAMNYGQTYTANPAALPDASLAASVIVPEPLLGFALPVFLLGAGFYRTRRTSRTGQNV